MTFVQKIWWLAKMDQTASGQLQREIWKHQAPDPKSRSIYSAGVLFFDQDAKFPLLLETVNRVEKITNFYNYISYNYIRK